MSLGGTASYRDPARRGDLPDLVSSAVAAAEAVGFEFCVRPEIGRLLAALAGGVPPGGSIGETGTGTGAGVAWMQSAAHPETRIVSYELDEQRAAAAQRLFEDHHNIEIVCADASELFGRGPFDLLVHDGGPGSGKHPSDELVDPATVLTPGGTMTLDDVTPAVTWPPTFRGEPDEGRLRWLTHPQLCTTEIRVAADLAVLVARYLPSG